MMEYKGYVAKVDYDPEDHLFYGIVSNVRGTIAFDGESPCEIEENFRLAVDSYLQTCKKSGIDEMKPLSGKFVVRLPPDMHRALTIKAKQEHKSLNALICDRLSMAV
jgi:predicted HicB family RNase H-like nuclease